MGFMCIKRQSSFTKSDTFSFETPDSDFKWKLHNGQIQENKDKKISLPSKYEPTLIMGILNDLATQVTRVNKDLYTFYII